MVEASVRAFFAVGLDAALRDEARTVASTLRERIAALRRQSPRSVDARFTNEDGWHVTLRFLGNVAPVVLGELVLCARTAVEEIAPFDIRLGRAMAFPPRRPRTLALDVVPREPLADVALRLDRACAACGFEPEARAFRPHLTLARTRGAGLRERDAEGVAALGAARQRVSDVVLFQSELRPSGALYTPLERVELGAEVHP